jgi:DNA-binding GntR family transcriptional regulator
MKTINFEVKSIDTIINASCITKEGSLVNQIYLVLRENIINLSLPPETRLVEKEIAAAFEISKTPVREALIRLVNERLVTIVPQSGSFVTSISLERYLDACFVRVSLESGCVKRLANKGISLSQQVKLKSLIIEEQQIMENTSGDNDEQGHSPTFEINELFHRTLFEYAGLIGAWQLLDSSKAEMERVWHLEKRIGIRRTCDAISEHYDVVEAIINRDPIAAEVAMADHIGDVDGEMNIISKNPQLMKSIEEFNLLISQQRKRSNTSKVNSKVFARN